MVISSKGNNKFGPMSSPTNCDNVNKGHVQPSVFADKASEVDNTKESVLGSMGHYDKIEDKPQCKLNKISGSDSSEALCLHNDGCMDSPTLCKTSKATEYMSKCNLESPQMNQTQPNVPSA